MVQSVNKSFVWDKSFQWVQTTNPSWMICSEEKLAYNFKVNGKKWPEETFLNRIVIFLIKLNYSLQQNFFLHFLTNFAACVWYTIQLLALSRNFFPKAEILFSSTHINRRVSSPFISPPLHPLYSSFLLFSLLHHLKALSKHRIAPLLWSAGLCSVRQRQHSGGSMDHSHSYLCPHHTAVHWGTYDPSTSEEWKKSQGKQARKRLKVGESKGISAVSSPPLAPKLCL